MTNIVHNATADAPTKTIMEMIKKSSTSSIQNLKKKSKNLPKLYFLKIDLWQRKIPFGIVIQKVAKQGGQKHIHTQKMEEGLFVHT